MRREEKSTPLSNLSIYYTWKNIKRSYNNNKFKISALTWNEKSELPDRSYTVSDNPDYFEYILQMHGENTDNSKTRIYVNKIEDRITLKIKTRYHLVLLTSETMKLVGSTENKITEDENGKNVLYLEITEVVLLKL